MLTQLRIAVLSFLALTLITGLVYPLLVTGIAQIAMPGPANGSMIVRDCKIVGSALIGQPFDDPKYFWSRPSATGPTPYNAGASSGSNLAIGNPAQLDAVKSRVEKLRAADPGNSAPVPIDLVTASGSGLDPHISPAAAEYQAGRVARVRGISIDRVRQLVAAATSGRQLGLLGDPVVNVLKLNLALDAEPGARATP
ncbi:MAG: potassium-transporting ATPase KdpC subunit [Planctomycetota bacterium]